MEVEYLHIKSLLLAQKIVSLLPVMHAEEEVSISTIFGVLQTSLIVSSSPAKDTNWVEVPMLEDAHKVPLPEHVEIAFLLVAVTTHPNLLFMEVDFIWISTKTIMQIPFLISSSVRILQLDKVEV